MRIGRLEFGFSRYMFGQSPHRPRFKFCACKCYSFTFWRFFATWLSDICMPSPNSIAYGNTEVVDRFVDPAVVFPLKETPMATKKKTAKKAPAKKTAKKKKK
jgi:hypothetical protein